MMAGIIHRRATGKTTLFDAAVKATDFLCHFYETASAELARNAICPSHYMGVVEMYRATGNPRYLELSKNLIDIRGMVEMAPMIIRTVFRSVSNTMRWDMPCVPITCMPV